MALQFVTEQIKDSAITADKVAADAVSTAKVVDLAISTAKLANDSVTSSKIADDAVGADQLAANAVVFASIASAAYETDLSVSASSSKLVTADAAKAYTDSVAQGLDLKESCRLASTSNFAAAYVNGSSGVGATLTANANGAFSIDGVAGASGNRVLIKDQTAALQNGIYTITTVGDGSTRAVLTRATDFDTSAKMDKGSFTFVEEGTANADSGFVMTTDTAITVGTDDIDFTQFSGAGSIVAGDGLAKSGNTLSVNVDDSSIEIASDSLQVKASGITNAMLAGSIADSKLLQITSSDKVAGSAVQLAASGGLEDSTGLQIAAGGVTNAMLAGSIENAKLVNSTISGVALGANLNSLSPATNGGILFSAYNGSAAVNNLQLDVSDLSDAAVDVATDSIAIYDSSEDATGKESIADLMTAVAGTAISASSGVLSVSGLANAQIDASAAIQLSKLEAVTSAKFIVGNASNVATQVSMSGDATLSNTGALAIGNNKIVPAMIASTVAGNGIAGGAGSAISVDINTGEPLSADISSSGKLGIVLSATGGLEKASSQLQIKLDGAKLQTTASGLTIKAGGVDTDAIGDNQVTIAKLADLSRGSLIYGNASGESAELAVGGADTVLATNGTDIAYAKVDNGMIDANAAIALTKLESVSSANIIVGNASNQAASVAMSGDVAIANNGATTIQANAISSAKIADGAVSTAKIADDAVTFAKMGITPVVQRVASTSSTSSLTLSSRITDATYRHPANVRVFLNGQRLIGLSSGSASGYEQYTISDDGSDTSISFGSALPDGSDLYVEYYA